MGSESFNPAGWSGYFTATADHLKTPEAVELLVIDLGALAPAGFWEAVHSTGQDVRIVNAAGDTAYSFFLTPNFNKTSEIGAVFFSAGGLSTSVDTVWRVYAGNGSANMPGTTDTLGRNAVFSAARHFYGFGQNPGGSAPQLTDWTAQGNNGTVGGPGMVSGDLVAGPFGAGSAWDFGGSDFVGVSDIANQTGGITHAALLKTTSTDNTKGYSLNAAQTVLGDHGGDVAQGFGVTNGKLQYNNLSYGTLNSTVSVNDGNWHFGALVIAAANAYLYVDGVLEATGAGWALNNTFDFDSIGGGYLNGSGRGDLFTGQLSLLRVDHAVRSANWMLTHSNNLLNQADFWTAGTWKELVPPVLSDPTAAATGPRTATGSVTTDEAGGELFAVVTTADTAPTAEQIQAGTDHADQPAAWSDSLVPASAAEQQFSATGLEPETGYYFHFVQVDAAENVSNVETSALLTTEALPVTKAGRKRRLCLP